MSAQSDTQSGKVGVEQGAERMFVKSGGTLDIESGGALNIAGTDKTAALADAVESPVAGVADGYKIARGVGTLDGSNPTSVAHGLGTCVSVVATLKGTAAPGLNTSVITANINGANVDFYAWKPTNGTDPTLIASTGTENFYWQAVGT